MRTLNSAFVAVLTFGSFGLFASAETIEEAAEASVAGLANLSGEDFIMETESILTRWAELGGSSSNYFDASETIITEIDRFIKDSGVTQDQLYVPVNGLQMIALNYTGGKTAAGVEFTPEAALAIYDQGLVTTRWGPPISYRGEYQAIMKRIYMETWNRSSLDGLTGEETPSAYAKMLFDVHDALTLCEAGEAVFWSCSDPDRDRILSVCGSPSSARDSSWVQYRIGQPGDLEMSYPPEKLPNFASEEAMMAGDGHFSRDVWRYGGSTLEFSNGQYDYAIEDESFTDSAIVTARRGDDRVFELSCKTTHPFMDTIDGHLWGASDDAALHILPGARSDVGTTACEAGEDIVWSCLDTRDNSTNSVCSVPSSGEPAVLYRKIDSAGTITNSAFEDNPVPLSSDLVWVRDEPTFSGIAIGDFAERYHFTTNKDGTGEFTWSKNEGERSFTQTCSVTHDNILSVMTGEGPSQDDDVTTPDNASFTYDPQPIVYGELSASPDEFDSLILQLKGLQAAGHFEAGAGMEPLDVLGGKAAIPFALDYRAADFRCDADHGGMCAGPNDLYSMKAFLVAFRGKSGIDWFSAESDKVKTIADIDLSNVSLSFETFSPPGTTVAKDGRNDAGFCQARAYFDDWEKGVEMYQSVADQLKFEDTPQYEWLWASFYGVVGRYNVRAGPATSAEIVGHAENEAIHFPEFDDVTSAGGHDWRRVVLPDGTIGYIGASSADLLTIDDAGQVCAQIEDGEVKLTSVSIGGE